MNFKTLTSFFRFYYYMIKRSPKMYDLAMNHDEALVAIFTPVFMWIVYMFFAIGIGGFAMTMSFSFLVLPIFGNLFIVQGVTNRGFAIEREKYEREQRAKEEEERKRKHREHMEFIKRMQEKTRYWEQRNKEEQEARERAYRQQQQQPRQDTNMKNAMHLLGLSQGFTEQDVKRAYRSLSKIHHPDVGGLESNFIRLNTAYNYIMERM